MALHPLAQRFASVADRYERGRPEYPPAVAGAIAAELGIPAGGRVLDLAAGTGKLSRAVLKAGYDVVAVEPLESLRVVLASKIGGNRVLEGVAEAIPLADGSVDAVTVADAFHWFGQAAALKEMRRVLRPRGGIAIISTIPDWGGASWAHELGQLMMKLRPEHPHFDGPSWKEAVNNDGAWTEPRDVRVTVNQPARPDLMADYLGSMSWIAAMEDDQQAATLAKVDELVRGGETPDELPMHFGIGLASLL